MMMMMMIIISMLYLMQHIKYPINYALRYGETQRDFTTQRRFGSEPIGSSSITQMAGFVDKSETAICLCYEAPKKTTGMFRQKHTRSPNV
jgi:hypothetical protein